ncbi:hypothetical protein EV702DRAFT_1193622 [Suillus placidus]|uniref:Uncharacterized protein n=1 Tax=Suillus placidus TaxID=48579 RepID=A0A9P7A2Z2_9AGAM|nr:hypothetical protein EV702DRAFT_1193622 [Suillus placidus]
MPRCCSPVDSGMYVPLMVSHLHPMLTIAAHLLTGDSKYFALLELILILTSSTCGQAETWKNDIMDVLQPLAAKGSLFTAVNRIIQTGIATIIVLEYSAFLPHKDDDILEHIKSAVDYYLKSPTAVAVEKGAKEISSQGYKKEELREKILEFILENRLSKDLTAKP